MDEQAVERSSLAPTVLQHLTEAHRSLEAALAEGKPKPKILKNAAEQAVPRLADALALLTSGLAPTEADFQLALARREAADLREQLEIRERAKQEDLAARTALQAELKDAQEQATAAHQDFYDASDRYQAEKVKTQLLIEQLSARDHELELARASQSKLELVHSQQVEAQAQYEATVQTWQGRHEALQTGLNAATAQIAAQRTEHDHTVKQLTAEVTQWRAAHDRAASERNILFDERSRAEAALQRQESEIAQRLARELGPLLVTLSVMAGQEASQEHISARRPFEGIKRVLRNLLGGVTPEPFPTAPIGHAIVLNHERDSMEALLAQYDWEPAQPFAGAQVECQFHLITRGWRAGDLVLAKAVLMPVVDEAAGTS